MPERFLIADTHLKDENIIKFENRPFLDVTEMDRTIINNWNNALTIHDICYVVGDFMKDCDISHVKEVLDALNGKIVLIKGNHDDFIKDLNIPNKFEVIPYEIILDDFWILSHCPKYVSLNSPYANIFGDVHNNPMYKTISPRSYCVSAERINYTPINFADVKKAVKECQ